MAKLPGGIHSGISGKIGPVVGVFSGGTYYLRTRPRRNGKAKGAELLNREKFKVAQLWLRPLLDVVRIGFDGHNGSAPSRGFIMAKSVLMKTAMEQQGNTFVVIPERVQLSSGNLDLPAQLTASRNKETGNISFSWDTKNYPPRAGAHAVVATYGADGMIAGYDIGGVTWHEGKYEFPAGHEEGRHCWIFFVSADAKSRTPSAYLGFL